MPEQLATETNEGAPRADTGPPADPAINPVFEFTDERRFALYMAERENLAKGAREAYQRFEQIIVGVSAGAIVLSISFLKDIGRAPETLGWLLGSWGCFLVASFCALLSLWTSAERDRDAVKQLDCQVETGSCDEAKLRRFTLATVTLNTGAFILMIAGVLLIIIFATKNVLRYGGKDWPKDEKTVAPNPPVQVNVTVTRDLQVKTETAAVDTQLERPSREPAVQQNSPKKDTQATPSPRR
jgi:hypothetical protein